MRPRSLRVAVAVAASLTVLLAGRTGVRPLHAAGEAGPLRAAGEAGPLHAAGATGASPSAPADLKPTVILVSIDAWRWDFRDRVTLPALEGLIARGVRAEWLV